MNEDIKYKVEKNSIKIWPYLDDLSQAIVPYSVNHLNKESIININFSGVKRVNSSGGAIALSKLVSMSLRKDYLFNLIVPEDKFIENYFQNSGFFAVIDNHFHFVKNSGDLFKQIQSFVIEKNTKNHIVFDEQLNIKKNSFPIFHLKYNPNNERESVDEFSNWLDDNVLIILDNYNVKTDILYSILTEIAKNSQDHTENDAFFGIDIIEVNGKNGEFLFSCSDMGKGISKTVRKFLKENPQKDLRFDAWRHFSFTDCYKWAFTLGNTSSKKTTNKGIGMTMIIDGAHNLDMDLSIWDADSMMLMPKSLYFYPESLNHEELRKRVYNTGNKVGFYYYGRLKF